MTRVLIVGAGLLGASLGQALTKVGHGVYLTDQSDLNLRLAVEYGAGTAASELGSAQPDIVFVCVPPDHVAKAVVEYLMRFPSATVTDVASVKDSILSEVAGSVDAADLARYVGSHPMAGREKSGPASARADLFYSRPWVICPHALAEVERVLAVRQIAIELSALPLEMSPSDHDAAVAMVSHLPQLLASALAGQLVESEPDNLRLAGQGLRDTVRIASSDPGLWLQILSRNSSALAPMVSLLADQLAEISRSLRNIEEPGSLRNLHELLVRGNQGVARIPGKHGGNSVNYTVVTVLIDDRPGQLAKLLTEVGEIGVNLEDMSLSHSPGAPIGIVELSVLPDAASSLVAELESRGWRLT